MAEFLFSDPRPRGPSLPPQVAMARSLTILAVLGIVGAIYFAKAMLVPLAIAILLTSFSHPPCACCAISGWAAFHRWPWWCSEPFS